MYAFSSRLKRTCMCGTCAVSGFHLPFLGFSPHDEIEFPDSSIILLEFHHMEHGQSFFQSLGKGRGPWFFFSITKTSWEKYCFSDMPIWNLTFIALDVWIITKIKDICISYLRLNNFININEWYSLAQSHSLYWNYHCESCLYELYACDWGQHPSL